VDLKYEARPKSANITLLRVSEDMEEMEKTKDENKK